MKEFFWLIAGSDKDLLNDCGKSVQIKHTRYGIIILLTAIIAGISMGYAITTIFHNLLLGIGSGIFWGFTVLIIDSIMVGTIKKQNSWKKKHLEFLQASVRYVFAIVLALLISKPLEVKMLKKQIERFMADDSKVMIEEYNSGYQEAYNIEGLSEIDKDLRTEFENENSKLGQITNESGYKNLDKVYKNCLAGAKNIQNNIDFESRFISKINAFREKKYVSFRDMFVSNDGTEYSMDNLPGGLSGNVKKVPFVNSDGKKRIKESKNRIKRLKSDKSSLGCSTLRTDRDNYYEERKSEIESNKTNIVTRKSKNDKKLNENKGEAERLASKSIEAFEESTKEFFGWYVALEKAKKDPTLFSLEEVSEDDKGKEYMLKHKDNNYPDTLPFGFDFEINSVKLGNDTVAISYPNSKANFFKEYIREDLTREKSWIEKLQSKNVLWWASNGLFILFLIFEVLPITSKLFAAYDEYDELKVLKKESVIKKARKKYDV